jgi:hypothetical protein
VLYPRLDADGFFDPRPDGHNGAKGLRRRGPHAT